MTTATAEQLSSVVDVQSQQDQRQLAINRVGIKNIHHPLQIKQKNGDAQHAHVNCDMTVFLDHQYKGTHMSRFVEILHAQQKPLTVLSLADILHTMIDRLKTTAAYVDFSFPYFLKKKAPVSEVESYLDYQVRFFGEIINNKVTLGINVTVPITSLCPCSKQISDYGAHNQRSHVNVTVHVNGLIWVEDLIQWVEQEASCQLYGLLKRVDEKYVTEYAYDHPKFVEDLVRDLALHLEGDPRVSYYKIGSENFESIHNHSAYAMVEKQK